MNEKREKDLSDILKDIGEAARQAEEEAKKAAGLSGKEVTTEGVAPSTETPSTEAPPIKEESTELKLEEGEIERKINEAKREIFEGIGEHSPEEVSEKIEFLENILKKEKEDGQGKLKDTIEEIKESAAGNEYFVDGSIAYLPATGEAVFIGDLHGDAEAVASIVEQSQFVEKMEKEEKDNFLVFLGDYGDRGQKDIATIEEIINLKSRYPDNVILLRGNHEEEDIARRYGLLLSLVNKYGEEGRKIFARYNEMVKEMIGALVTGNGIVAVHGGIPSKEIMSLKDLNDEKVLEQMRWNDPTETTDEREHNIDRDPENLREDYTVFGKNAFQRFLQRIGGKVMIRSHEYPAEGQEVKFDGRLATIFSNGSESSTSSGYKKRVEQAIFASLKLDEARDKFSPDSDFFKVLYGERVTTREEEEEEVAKPEEAPTPPEKIKEEKEVEKKMEVRIKNDRQVYWLGSEIITNLEITEPAKGGVKGAEISADIYDPNGESLLSGSTLSNERGEAELKGKLREDAPTGIYLLEVSVAKEGFGKAVATTTFEVVEKPAEPEEEAEQKVDRQRQFSELVDEISKIREQIEVEESQEDRFRALERRNVEAELKAQSEDETEQEQGFQELEAVKQEYENWLKEQQEKAAVPTEEEIAEPAEGPAESKEMIEERIRFYDKKIKANERELTEEIEKLQQGGKNPEESDQVKALRQDIETLKEKQEEALRKLEEVEAKPKSPEELKSGLEEARKRFVETERELQKVGKKVKEGKKKPEIKEEYEKAKKEYESLRALYIAGEIEKFVEEKSKLADERAEEAKERSRLLRIYKKLGDWNLDALFGEKVKNKYIRFGLRMMSARTGISLGLLGAGAFFGIGTGAAVGVPLFLARRGFSAVSTGVGVYDPLKRFFVERLPSFKKVAKEVKEENLETIEKRMAQFEVKSALRGEKVSENETYKYLQDKYRELLSVEREKQPSPEEQKEAEEKAEKVDAFLDKMTREADAKLEKVGKKAKWSKRGVKAAAIGIGLFVGSGAWSGAMREQWGEIGGFIKEKLPSGEEVLVPITKAGKKVAQAARGGTEFIKDKLTGGEKIVEVSEPPVVETTPEISETPAEAPSPEMPPEAPSEIAPKPPVVEVAPEAEIKEVFTETVQKNEGYLHQARKAIGEYLYQKKVNLTEAQKLKAESDLYELLKEKVAKSGEKLKGLHLSDKVGFSRGDISKVVEDVQERFGNGTKAGEQLQENLKDYVEKVKWNRYEIGDKGGKWLEDEGVKAVKAVNRERVAKMAEKLATKITDASPAETREVSQEAADALQKADELLEQIRERKEVLSQARELKLEEPTGLYREWQGRFDNEIDTVSKGLKKVHRVIEKPEISFDHTETLLNNTKKISEDLQGLAVEHFSDHAELAANIADISPLTEYQEILQRFETVIAPTPRKVEEVNNILEHMAIGRKSLSWEQIKDWKFNNNETKLKACKKVIKKYFELKERPSSEQRALRRILKFIELKHKK